MFASSPRRRPRRKLVSARVVGCGTATSAARKHKHASAVEVETHRAEKKPAIAASALSKRVAVPKNSIAHVPAHAPHFAGPVHLDAKIATVRFVRELVKNVPPPASVPFVVKVRYTLRRLFFRGDRLATNLCAPRSS